MAKHLLSCASLLLAFSLHSQVSSTKLNQAAEHSKNFANQDSGQLNLTQDSGGTASKIATLINWQKLCGSNNVLGMTESHSRPLQFNPYVNTVSFLHNKSATYSANPVGPSSSTSGVIVAEISTNFGSTWDSTCIWNDPANAGRFPQGAIYSSPGNTNIANAYIVGCGAAVSNNTYTGNWYASKKLAAAGSTLYNNSVDPALAANQFIPFTGPAANFSVTGQHGWSRYGFTSTNDGAVRSLALIQNDNTQLDYAAGMRGVAVIKGSYNGGVFNWTSDSLIPNCVSLSTLSAYPGAKVLSSNVQMAWNPAGTVGYVVMLGALSTASNQNMGYQPIIYKTTNSGVSWSPVNGINFSAPTFSSVLSRLSPVYNNSTLTIPYFYEFDITVDCFDKLHIGAILASTSTNNTDSLKSLCQFTVAFPPAASSDKYLWRHIPGYRPFIYDIYGDGFNPWAAYCVDSLSTEAPGTMSGESGFDINPWDSTGLGTKLSCGPRLQLARTPDGKFITYSWSDSDTNFVSWNRKYNVVPNIYTRCFVIEHYGCTYMVASGKGSVSKPAAGTGTVNLNVFRKSFLYNLSPVTAPAQWVLGTGSYTANINTFFTVNNNTGLKPMTNSVTWFTNSTLSYSFPANECYGGLHKNELDAVPCSLYPNPCIGIANLEFYQQTNSPVNLHFYNLTGQLVKSFGTNAKAGENKFNIEVGDLSPGIYLVQIRFDNETLTKKLIIQN